MKSLILQQLGLTPEIVAKYCKVIPLPETKVWSDETKARARAIREARQRERSAWHNRDSERKNSEKKIVVGTGIP